MESSKTRLHPLLTAAAVSVTVFSAVGVAALTGVLPHSFGSSKDSAALSQAAPATALEQVQERAAPPAPVASDMPPAAPVTTPVKKPVKKHLVAKAPAPKAAPAADHDFAAAPPPPPPATQAPAPVVAQAPAPAPAGILGVVQSVREISTPAKQSNGIGPIAGGIAGAVLGNQVGRGDGRTIATVLGGAAGAFGGAAIVVTAVPWSSRRRGR